jgi:type II secretory pathway pseudopilin PulG
LLIVIVIILILLAATAATYSYSISADRVRAGARQLQSMLVGARDKAIYAKDIRGVRLLLDPTDNHMVNAVQYIGSPQKELGLLTFDPTYTSDSTGQTIYWKSGTAWSTLSNLGLLRAGARIQIPSNTGQWYYVASTGNASSGFLVLNQPVSDFAGSKATFGYTLELSPTVLGDAEPVQLPRGVVIDLDGSQLPLYWYPGSFGGSFLPRMDILFTPRGTVTGDATSVGMLHFHIADAGDVTRWHQISGRSSASYAVPVVPADNVGASKPIVTRDRILVTTSVLTGGVSVHYVNSANSSGLSKADDPYLFAETGQVANK